MNCYYCGNVISEEEKICSKCGRGVKEININLDSLNINKVSGRSTQSDEIFNDVTSEIRERINPVKETNKVVVKIKPKNK